MSDSALSTLAVVGSGTMGAQIAQQSALYGYEVRLTDVREEQLRRARESNRGHLSRRVAKGQLTQEEMEGALGRVRTTTSLQEAVAGADMVIEAVIEELEAKRAVFRELDRLSPPEVILASNSSTIVISEIVEGSAHPERAVNMHFFHPVLVLKLVEIVQGRWSSPEAAATAMAFARSIGKEPVLMTREIPGFIVNRILHALSREAMWLAEEGYATPEEIDRAVKLGLNHPMGPFELADFSGLDITYNARMHTYNTTNDPKDRPPRILEEKVKAGQLGRKTGKGFYEYPPRGDR